MLEKIKSTFFVRLLFSHIDEKVKLKIINYNNNLQKKLEINIYHYVFLSGKLVLIDKDGKGKEIQGKDKRIIFEGQYLNGKRNGKGKEYDERKYLDFGILSDLVKEIKGKKNDKNYVKFEGEYLNGKRNGKGKEYNEEGELEFEGDYLNGMRNGKGKEYFEGGLVFEGEYLNNKKWKGKGYDINGDIIYELNNNNNQGKEVDMFGELLYEGEYLNGERNGNGKEYDAFNRLIFEGKFYKGKRWTGKGYDGFNNVIYELKDGKGFVKQYYIDNNNIMFEGEYLNGEKNGKGKEYYHDGDLEYEGEFLQGMRNGKGKLYYEGNLIFEGDYLYDYQINGKEYDEDGKLLFEGNYFFNKRWEGMGRKYNKDVKILSVVFYNEGKKVKDLKIFK